MGVPALQEPLAGYLQDASQGWEQMLHRSLAAPDGPATRLEAAQVLFWVVCSLRWLEDGLFADPPGAMLTNVKFKPLMTMAPQTLDEDQRKTLDRASRDVLRGLGGIPHVRSSHIHHLLDSPIARAWWRVEIAQQAESSAGGELTLGQCHEALLQKGCWRAWTNTAMTRAGRLSAGPCAAAFVTVVRNRHQRDGKWPNEGEAGEIASSMARRSAAFYPGLLDHQALAALCG